MSDVIPSKDPETPPLRMEAYYYGFGSTGIPEIDKILSAIACAGKAYHHTESWQDDCDPYPGHTGGTPVDWIWNAAQEAADAWRARVTAETNGCQIRPHDFCSAGTCGICMDAQRYRWLRDQAQGQFCLTAELKREKEGGDDPDYTAQWFGKMAGQFVDSAIDAELAQLAQKTERNEADSPLSSDVGVPMDKRTDQP